MNKKTIVAIIIALFIEMPIWVYLIYWILSQLNPDRLVWFLFWAYVPVVITTSILGKIIAGEKR
jgi:NhaP-type Na+/H+ or K+/H+ antiporter